LSHILFQCCVSVYGPFVTVADIAVEPSLDVLNESGQPQLTLEGMEVILEPGEILFIPALWFHQVETLDELAVSVNVWSQYKPVMLTDKLLNDVYLPCVTSSHFMRQVASNLVT
jgi:hypothetical protein